MCFVKRQWLDTVSTFIIENFIPLGFVVVVVFALAFPYPGIIVGSLKAENYSIIEVLNVSLVFFISGISLKIDDLWTVMKFPAVIAYGIIFINFLTTLAAFIMIELPFPRQEFAIGLTIFAVVPTTLGVGVALTQAAKGNQIMSLLLTVSSNLLGILTVPYLLQLYLRGSSDIKLQPSKLLMSLTFTGI